MAVETGWERKYRVHFDEIVENYDKVRWEYPCELFEDIFNYRSHGNDKKALEIGAGTGKATAPFLNAGFDVTAVEMSANMSGFLIKKFSGHGNFSVITDTFENASLEEGIYDLVYAATAFHWVDAEIGCPKVFRLLKNGGTFALFRYNVMPSDGEELYEEIQSCYEKFYNSYYTTSKRPMKKAEADFWTPSELYTSFRFNGMEQYGFCDITMKLYDRTRTFSADEYMLLLDTNSDHRALPEDNRAKLYSGVREAIMKHGGHHKVNCIFQLYIGKKK